jgi:anti-sigma factor RsiW
MTCREVIAFLDEYVSQELDEGRAAAFERHLAECQACVAYLASYRQTIAMSRAALTGLPADMPPDLVRAVMAAVGR